jgi:hypothetical protein
MNKEKLELLLKAVDPVKLVDILDDEMIGNLLCNACEGGSNYWAESNDNNSDEVGADYFHEAPLKKGGFFNIKDREDEDAPEVRIDRKALNRGIEVMATKYPWHLANVLTENDDAETGDVFLQCSAFGEIVYG